MVELTVTCDNRYRMRANNHKAITVSTGTIEANLLKVYGQPTVQIDGTAYFICSLCHRGLIEHFNEDCCEAVILCRLDSVSV